VSDLPAAYSTIAIDVTGAAAWIRFNRPEIRNTVDAPMVDEIYAALRVLAERDDVHVVVLTGNGPTFSPGANLKRDPTAPASLPARESYHAARLLMEMPKVTVAAINGACAGAGLGYAAACDLRLAVSTARFAVGFIEIGVSGELGLGWVLTHILGAARAKEMMLLTRKFTAQEAYDFGLLTRVFEPDEFSDQVAAIVDELCGRSPDAVRDIRANFVDAINLPLDQYIERETDRHTARFIGAGSSDTLASLIARGRSISSAAGTRH
jgi:2-(1,2-epoxy-1,2-dihydrophenyl)acetyl-CoA isomerase